jgi:hypothetical protein
MKLNRFLILLIGFVFLTACSVGSVGPPSLAQPSGETVAHASETARSTSPQAIALPTLTSSPSATLAPSPALKPTATLTPQPTNTPTQTLAPTHDPTVYDPGAIGDSRNLDSYVVSVLVKTSGNGTLEKFQCNIEYQRQPLTFHKIIQSSWNRSDSDQGNSKGETYQVGDWVYSAGSGAGFSVQPVGRDFAGLNDAVDLRHWAGISYFNSAKYVGQETYQGEQVYHYTVDPSNLKSNLGKLKIDKAQGDIYLTVVGNYLLHYNFDLGGNVVVIPGQEEFAPGKLEYVGDLTKVNQPLEIILPEKYGQVIFDPGVPLPEGTTLDMIGFSDAGKVGYNYTTPVSLDDFMAFYKNMPPTNGWSVLQAGDLANPLGCQNCVLVSKDNLKMVLEWKDRMDHYAIQIHGFEG